jgi:hypothetical protein
VIDPRTAAAIERNARACHPNEPPPNPWGTSRWRCVAGCGATPLGGFRGPIDRVMLESSSAGVAVWVRDTSTGNLGVCCGENCHHTVRALVARGTVPPYERVSVPAAASEERPQRDPQGRLVEERVVVARCAHCGCSQNLDQRRVEGGEWTPDESRVLTVAGWLLVPGARYCSALCGIRARAARPQEPVTPVLEVSDVSYRAARARAQQPPQPAAAANVLVNREVPEPPKPTRGKGGR